MRERTYLCIDLKSFYASVECVAMGLDPMTTDLVVADMTRTEKTICLAVSPSLKAKGVKNRCRYFEIPKSLSFITAQPRMQEYINVSVAIHKVFLKYVSPRDMHVYSIDESFLDVTEYLSLYKVTPKELIKTIMQDIYETTGIPSSGGIGTNLYLTKVALDITAKHAKDRIGFLDEESYVRDLAHHLPLTDFWRIGKGTEERLHRLGLMDMEDIRHCDPERLYEVFGIDAELLIDHAWGKEPVTIEDIQRYKPSSKSLSSGQVLPHNYNFEEGLLILKEMSELLCLDLVSQGLVSDHITLSLGYGGQKGFVNASASLPNCTASYDFMKLEVEKLYRRIANHDYPLRKINISFNHLKDERFAFYDLFSDPQIAQRDKALQEATLKIKHKFGKNAVFKVRDLQEAATLRERNAQIGGHRSGQESSKDE